MRGTGNRVRGASAKHPASRVRLLIPIALLWCVTGAALVTVAQLTKSPPPRTVSGSSDINVAIARDFYVAVNEMMATGDSRSLESIVAGHLIEHPAWPVCWAQTSLA